MCPIPALMTEMGTLWFLAAVAQLWREVYDVNLQPAGNIFDNRLNCLLWLLIAIDTFRMPPLCP